MEQKYISELHKEHKEWLSNLQFCKDEISSFENRLSEVAAANSKTEVTAEVEHFQNQFIRQREVIDELGHEIRENEHAITEAAAANNVATEHRRVPDNAALREKVETFNKLYAELKAGYNKFLSGAL